jgi:PAS domain S-box-containing protein
MSKRTRSIQEPWLIGGRKSRAVASLGVGLACLFSGLHAWGQAAFRNAQGTDEGSPAPQTTLTNLAQLRQLDRDQAGRGFPVRVHAVISYVENQWPTLFIQDDTSAAYVFRPPEVPPLSAGDTVVVEGQSDVGYAPVLRANRIQVLGKGPLPEPVRTSLEELATGRYDCMRVSVTTTIRWMFVAYDRLYLHVGESTSQYEVQVPEYRGPLPVHLLDARVRLTGIAGVRISSEGHLLGVRITFSSLDEIELVTPAPEEPWARTTQLISTLMWFHPSTSYGQRTKISGVVTLRTPSGQLYVQDESAAVEVRLPPFQERIDPAGKFLDSPLPFDLRPGDQVEVLGYPALGRHAPILVDAWVRRTGAGQLPAPTVLAVTNTLQGHLDARRVQLQGRLIASDTRPIRNGIEQRLTLEEDGSAFLTEYEGSEPLRFRPESRLELTGVVALEVDEWKNPRSFRLLVASPGDVRLLAAPPRFTAANVLRVAVPLGLFLGAWVWWLRRQIGRERAVARERERMRSAIEELNADLERRVAERVRLSWLTADVAVTLSENAALNVMLEQCAEHLVKHLEASRASIWTLQDQTLQLRACAGNGTPFTPPAVLIPVGQGVAGRAARDRKRLLTRHDDPEADRLHDSDTAAQTGAGDLAAFPLMLDGRVVGVAEVHCPRGISEHELKTLEAVADSLALGIERKHAEAALSDSEARYRTMTEHGPQAIVVIDVDTGRFTEVNENAVRLFGVGRSRLLELGPVDVSPPTQPDGQSSASAALVRIEETLGGDAPVFEWTHRHASGREIPCEVRVARIPVPGRRLVIGSVTDITERKRAEKSLLDALAREKELSELKSGFVSMVSHEFRTPLGVIMSATEILERYLDRLPPEKRRKHLDMIFRATRNLGHLVEEVLVLSKVEQGQIRFAPAPMDLATLCRQLADEVLSATNRACPIEFRPEGSLDGAHGDPSLLRHIFTNVLSNAVKYSPPGSPVTLTVNRNGDSAIFTVRDQGIGIPDEDQKRLFKSFARGGNVDQRPGTGLGLVIVKRCVELHGGRVALESRVGAGTSVVITIPMFS